MSGARRWLALDADMFGKRFTDDLYHEFGWAGVTTWIAFLCACKRSRVPGRIRIINELDARSQLGLLGWDLVDNEGKEWDLAAFWTFTGRKKQTKRTRRGRETNVSATHWEHWQKRTSHRKNGGPEGAPRAGADLDLDLDIPPTPPRGSGRRSASNGKSPTPEPPRPAVADWTGEPEPADPVDRSVLESFRAEKGWAKPETA